jgi:hypothetical protein
VVAAAAVAVRLPPAATKARATLLGPRSTTLGLTPSTCGRARLWVLLRPVLRSTSLPSLLHHSTALRRSRRGPHIHLPWHLSHCLELRLHSHLHGLRGLQSGTCSPSLAPLVRWSSPTPTPPPVADSGASGHTTPYPCTIHSSHPPSSAHPPSIIVGNGSILPITSVGDSVLPRPFYLNEILVAPNLVQNLLFVRRFTTDNSCSMEFDPFGLSV